jgi:hypothetical protein
MSTAREDEMADQPFSNETSQAEKRAVVLNDLSAREQ